MHQKREILHTKVFVGQQRSCMLTDHEFHSHVSAENVLCEPECF